MLLPKKYLMKPRIYLSVFVMIILFILSGACDEVVVEVRLPQLPVHEKDKKPDYPVQLGTIRGYFGDYYKTFDQHIEEVQPIDSFSNVFFYGSCHNDLKQINLIRCDSSFVLAMYVMGYP